MSVNPPCIEPPQEDAIPKLFGQVYAAAPPAERGHLVERLLQPLGVLSLVAVAHGIFANIRFRSGPHEIHVPLEELRRVGADDVAALVAHAQQVSVETVDNLAQWLAASPQFAASAAAGMLVVLLVQRSRRRQGLAAANEASLPPAQACAQ